LLHDGVCLLEGRGDAVLACLVSCEQAGGARELRLALCGRGVRHGIDGAYVPPTSSHVVHLFQFRCAGHGFLFVLWQSLGSEVAFQADAVDRDHWALRRLRASDILPRDDGEEIVRSRAVPPREIRAHRCLGGWPSSPSCVSLPVAYPVAKDNFNYTPVAVGGVLFLCVGAWVLNAPFWFR
jgi:hypothetical protein